MFQALLSASASAAEREEVWAPTPPQPRPPQHAPRPRPRPPAHPSARGLSVSAREDFGLSVHQRRFLDASLCKSNLRIEVTVNTHIAGRSHWRHVKRVAESFNDAKVLRKVIDRAGLEVPPSVELKVKDIIAVERIQSNGKKTKRKECFDSPGNPYFTRMPLTVPDTEAVIPSQVELAMLRRAWNRGLLSSPTDAGVVKAVAIVVGKTTNQVLTWLREQRALHGGVPPPAAAAPAAGVAPPYVVSSEHQNKRRRTGLASGLFSDSTSDGHHRSPAAAAAAAGTAESFDGGQESEYEAVFLDTFAARVDRRLSRIILECGARRGAFELPRGATLVADFAAIDVANALSFWHNWRQKHAHPPPPAHPPPSVAPPPPLRGPGSPLGRPLEKHFGCIRPPPGSPSTSRDKASAAASASSKLSEYVLQNEIRPPGSGSVRSPAAERKLSEKVLQNVVKPPSGEEAALGFARCNSDRGTDDTAAATDDSCRPRSPVPPPPPIGSRPVFVNPRARPTMPPMPGPPPPIGAGAGAGVTPGGAGAGGDVAFGSIPPPPPPEIPEDGDNFRMGQLNSDEERPMLHLPQPPPPPIPAHWRSFGRRKAPPCAGGGGGGGSAPCPPSPGRLPAPHGGPRGGGGVYGGTHGPMMVAHSQATVNSFGLPAHAPNGHSSYGPSSTQPYPPFRNNFPHRPPPRQTPFGVLPPPPHGMRAAPGPPHSQIPQDVDNQTLALFQQSGSQNQSTSTPSFLSPAPQWTRLSKFERGRFRQHIGAALQKCLRCFEQGTLGAGGDADLQDAIVFMSALAHGDERLVEKYSEKHEEDRNIARIAPETVHKLIQKQLQQSLAPKDAPSTAATSSANGSADETHAGPSLPTTDSSSVESRSDSEMSSDSAESDSAAASDGSSDDEDADDDAQKQSSSSSKGGRKSTTAKSDKDVAGAGAGEHSTASAGRSSSSSHSRRKRRKGPHKEDVVAVLRCAYDANMFDDEHFVATLCAVTGLEREPVKRWRRRERVRIQQTLKASVAANTLVAAAAPPPASTGTGGGGTSSEFAKRGKPYVYDVVGDHSGSADKSNKLDAWRKRMAERGEHAAAGKSAATASLELSDDSDEDDDMSSNFVALDV